MIADTGDGFDPTYTVAWCASQASLRPEGADRALPRGAYLILAGDEVYPVGSPREYESRFIGPYKAALAVDDRPSTRACWRSQATTTGTTD